MSHRLYVATTGEPYPLGIVTTSGGRVTLSEFGATFGDIVVPPADQVVDPGR